MRHAEHDRLAPLTRPDPWELNEIVRRRRLRAQAKRPLAVNLAEGLALCELLGSFRGEALLEMKRQSQRHLDRADLEALSEAHGPHDDS